SLSFTGQPALLIDPFIVLAQIVNFALLAWLLTRFLYGPVTRAMQARETRVREEMEQARRLHAAAEAERERYRALVAGFDAEREARRSEVQAELERLRHEHVAEARAEVKALRERWIRMLEQEKASFLEGLRLQVGRGSVVVMRRALLELADDDLEGRCIRRFVERLRAMPGEDRDQLAAAVRGAEAARVRSAFPLTDAQRKALVDALAQTLGVEPSAR